MTQRSELQQRADKIPAFTYFARSAVRGRALAEQRLAYLTELFESGRWRRFHTEADFLVNVREAKAAVDSWRRIEQFDPASARVRPVVQPAVKAPSIAPEPIEPNAASIALLKTETVAGGQRAGETDIHRPLVAPKPIETSPSVIALLEKRAAVDDRARESEARRLPLLPPVMFSANGIGAERNLLKA
ncbi:MAG: TIGR03809 family protein [Pseudomonadota bacterium]|jgi:uncharacterized repeat protein (TIGR03809 family)